MQNVSNSGETIDLQIQEAISAGRLPNDTVVSSVVSREIDTFADNVLSTILGGRYNVYIHLLLFITITLLIFSVSIYRGYGYTPSSPNVAEEFVAATLGSLRYNHGDLTDFSPKNICIVVIANTNKTQVACISIEFVGTNSQPPIISYEGKISLLWCSCFMWLVNVLLLGGLP